MSEVSHGGGGRAFALLLAYGALVAVALSASPLTAVHGVESALALGILLPPAVAACAALDALRWPARERLSLLRTTALRSLLAWGLPVLLLALGSVRVRQCTPLEGLTFMLLGPLVGVGLAALSGLTVGSLLAGSSLARRRTRAVGALGAMLPIGALGLGLFRFWSTPTISIYGAYAGWFPGTIYDEDVALTPTYVSQRALVVALTLGLAAVWCAARDPLSGRLRVAVARRQPGLLALGTLAVSLFVGAMVYAPELGHASSAAYIDEQLGRVLRGQRCVLHAPRELPLEGAERLLDDCEFSVAQAERGLGVTATQPVHAFFYRSAEEKRRLMGAGATFIAKPWRNEVHLQLGGWPHPVLAHEVVHAIARYASQGPFAVSGSLGGWFPNPGLIEGVAVAIAWDDRDGLTPDEWSAGLLAHDALPSPRDFLGLRFGTIEPRRAYSAAGSFVRYLREREGVATLREVHRLGRVRGVTRASLAELEAGWKAHLRTVPLPEGALDMVALRLTRGSIFETVCPHRVAQLRTTLAADFAAADLRSARRTCRELLAIDPNDLGTRAHAVGVEARSGDFTRAHAGLRWLQEHDAPKAIEAHAASALADAYLARDAFDRARDAYAALLPLQPDEASRRQIEVKLLALRASRAQARLLRALLLGDNGQLPGPARAMQLTQELDALRGDGLAPYLAARQLMGEGAYAAALVPLRVAELRGLPLPSLVREHRRMLAITLYALERWDELGAHLRGPMSEDPALGTLRAYWQARVEFRRGAR
ncbi:MAG: hypothetical protein IPH72_30290 [Sandaracinaceae bacterium]|nr:hypothetical protein [Sandaracinaceae bacterium]